MVATLFQTVGAALMVLFMFCIWPPLSLLGVGLFFLITGFGLERQGR